MKPTRHPLDLVFFSLLSPLTILRLPQSTLQVIKTSFKNEGPMFMFKGWVPAFSRLQPTTILIFLTYEQLKNLVDWTRGTAKAVD
jgi:hypothetical protein